VLPRLEFLKRFFQLAYKGRLLVVAFNLPFDVSRLAYDVTAARRKFAGGFSLRLWSYRDAANVEQRHPFRPNVAIKHLDSKRALIGFTGRSAADDEDQIPEDSETGEPDERYRFRGHFLDLRTLAFALTDRAHSLESACKAFGVAHPKRSTTHHGTVTPAYITYNRFDVLATWELAEKLLEEYDQHPIHLPVTQAFSPASLGKAYLRAMGIPPILQRQPDVSPVFLGHAQSAFFGGRTSARIRKVAVPVVYTDFLSMYPTVNTLMGLWRFVIGRRIDVVNHCTTEIIELLERVRRNPDTCFDRTMWPRFGAFVRIAPDGDVLPMRAKFSADHNDWQVAVNHLHGGEPPNESLWFALPDVVASVLLTGRIPKVVDAFRLEARGRLSTLTRTKLRGIVSVNPAREDFFMEDTDSMAIVATKSGGLVPCPGGRDRLEDGREAVKALSWADVNAVSEAFRALNPYDRSVVSASVLEIEKDNFDPKTKKQRQLWCVAISAKRYVLFLKDSRGEPILLRDEVNNEDDRWSENVYTVYEDVRRNEWAIKILPAVKRAPLAALVSACRGKLSRRAIIDIRAGRSTPHRRNQQLLASIVRQLETS
jgi:hypothetical protein